MVRAVPEEVVDGADGVEHQMAVLVGESFQQVLHDLLGLEAELLAVVRDVANGVDGVLEDTAVLVVLTDAPVDPQDDLIMLEFLEGLVVVLR
jgi:hypothetical protein